MKSLPKISFKKIKRRHLRNYQKNLDVHIDDSYFDTTNNTIHIEFPVHDKKIFTKGIYYYNLGFIKILVVHICHKNLDEIIKMNRNFIASMDISQQNLSNNNGSFNIGNFYKLHISVYNDDGVFPALLFNLKPEELFRPKEVGGGVIVEGP